MHAMFQVCMSRILTSHKGGNQQKLASLDRLEASRGFLGDERVSNTWPCATQRVGC
jgi:hypothetical protein